MTRFGAPVLIGENLGFTEGPLWTRDDRLALVGLSRGVLHELGPAPEDTRILAVAGGRPNGLAQGPDGRIWIAQAGGPTVPPSLQYVEDGRVRPGLAGGFHAPNDLAFGPDGRLWFTDPAGSALEGEPLPGRIWAYDIATGDLALMADGARFPNGLAFSPDGGALFVAETSAARIVRYPMQGGRLGTPAVFAQLPEGMPDGIALDRDGSLYVAALMAGVVLVFDATGRLADRLDLGPGSLPTNLCFGGEDRATLYVTAAKGGRVFAVTTGVQGLDLAA